MPLIQSFMSDRMGVAQKAAFFALSNEDRPHHTGIEAQIADIVAPRLAAMGYEFVRVAVLGRETADRADHGRPGRRRTDHVEDCEAISHAVGAVLDVDDPIPALLEPGGQLRGHRPAADPGEGLEPLRRPSPGWRLSVPPDGRKRFSGVVLGAMRRGAGCGWTTARRWRCRSPTSAAQARPDRRADRSHRRAAAVN